MNYTEKVLQGQISLGSCRLQNRFILDFVGPLNVNVPCEVPRFSTIIWQKIIFLNEACYTGLVFHKIHFRKVCLVNWLCPTETPSFFLYLCMNPSNVFLQFPKFFIPAFIYSVASHHSSFIFFPLNPKLLSPAGKIRGGNWLNLQCYCCALLSFQNL